MSVIEQLSSDMKAAMKAGEKEKLGVIRMLLSEAKNADLQKPVATPEQMIERYIKKLGKSLEEFEKVGRAGEVAQLKSEIEIASAYLPKKKDAAQTEALVVQFLSSNPTLTAKDLGKATGLFMKTYNAAGDLDAGLVNQLLRSKLPPS
jgi:uncharacterized protein